MTKDLWGLWVQLSWLPITAKTVFYSWWQKVYYCSKSGAFSHKDLWRLTCILTAVFWHVRYFFMSVLQKIFVNKTQYFKATALPWGGGLPARHKKADTQWLLKQFVFLTQFHGSVTCNCAFCIFMGSTRVLLADLDFCWSLI